MDFFEHTYYDCHSGGERLRRSRARRLAFEYQTRLFMTKLRQRLRNVFGK